MQLRPSETVQKALISSTARFIGEYESLDLLITLAWPNRVDPIRWQRWVEGPISRTALICAFETERVPKGSGLSGRPDYSHAGEFVSDSLSVFFGKRFDFHGMLENDGHFGCPDLGAFSVPCNPVIPFNSHKARLGYPVQLDLTETGRIADYLRGKTPQDPDVELCVAASRYYARALRLAERDAELAYVSLVTVGEIVANARAVSRNKCNDGFHPVVEALRYGDVEQRHAADLLARSSKGIKRRFVDAICELTRSEDLAVTESVSDATAITHDCLERRIAAAYELRSIHLHTGARFADWLALDGPSGRDEVHVGRPVLPDRRLSKAIFLAPTLLGLERVLRSCILELMRRAGAIDA